MISIWRQISRNFSPASPAALPSTTRFFSSSSPYLGGPDWVYNDTSLSGSNWWFGMIVKVGIPEFLRGIGEGVEAHVEKLESEFGDLQKLLVTRTLRLKKLEIPCKHVGTTTIVIEALFPLGAGDLGERKLILKHAHKYRVGLWRPRADRVKV
ncbi:hypothetical protein Cgig2_017619 [Carnegiea gigantea]|uniref:Small ribosomal subunit protein mS41 SAM domain-containing protein n=1 Tax=Carnegiea gigantea TaxID=171969 RepID=A0A9Q1JGW2_9CARY|nr:hypothetical protein Cgig2_017619 [Carnegiea gigantea]